MKITTSAVLASCLLLGLASEARADTCDTVRGTDPGVMQSFWCTQPWIDFYWDAYDFDKGDWDDGFGWEAACDRRRPLARTFQAIQLVNYASPNEALQTNDFSGNILRWGGNYTIREFDELNGRCGDGTARASTTWGVFIDNYTNLYIPFFYNENVVERAGTLLHEARHADWCGHSGNDGSNKCPAKSESCDERYTDGCSGVGSPSGKGANGYQVLWLWWYAYEADAQHSSSTMKAFARDEANRILNTMFDVDPCFNITSNGSKITTC
ncbi:hypothetical protein [Sorangium sp. So ce1153]|uniref:hypothetical protein n=1 Tax=Sorangium sp. So ce1153 TaxID=3133333 RepID=UPI003F5E693B